MSFQIMLHSGYVVQDFVAFRIMLLGIMSHSGLCRIGYSVVHTNVIQDNVSWVYVVQVYIVRDCVVRCTVGV